MYRVLTGHPACCHLVPHSDQDAEIYNWRKVIIKGHFLPFSTPSHRNPIKLGPRIIEGDNGYHLVLPFLRTPNDKHGPRPRAILINLGFIKKELIDEQGMRAIKIPQGEVELEGMLRRGRGESAEKRAAGKKPSVFMPDNDYELGEWFWMDAGGFAEYYSNKDTGDVMPLICDLTYGQSHRRATAPLLRFPGLTCFSSDPH